MYDAQLVDAVTGAALPHALMRHVMVDTSGSLLWREEFIERVYMAGAGPGSGRVVPDSKGCSVRCFRYGVCVVSSDAEHRMWRFDVAPLDPARDREVSMRS